jgi:hypothetical protein
MIVLIFSGIPQERINWMRGCGIWIATSGSLDIVEDANEKIVVLPDGNIKRGWLRLRKLE